MVHKIKHFNLNFKFTSETFQFMQHFSNLTSNNITQIAMK